MLPIRSFTRSSKWKTAGLLVINSLVTFVADSAATEASFSIVRQVAPPGFATPYHTHEAYGEGFYLLAGEVTFFCDGTKTVLRDRGFMYLPGTLPHGFRVSGDSPATMMIVSTAAGTFGAFPGNGRAGNFSRAAYSVAARPRPARRAERKIRVQHSRSASKLTVTSLKGA